MTFAWHTMTSSPAAETKRSRLSRWGGTGYRILVPPRAPGPVAHGIQGLVFGLGIALCFVWLDSVGGAMAVGLLGAVVMAIYFAATARRTGWHTPVLAAVLLLHYLGALYVSFACTAVLLWTLSGWFVLLTACLLGLAIAGALFDWRQPRVALCLPLGVWIAGLLAGWLHEDGRIDCDDYLRVAADDAVEIAVPSHSELVSCRPGEAFGVGRYPRRTWESPDGRSVVFTTQPGVGFLADERTLPDELTGSVCAAPLDGSERPECVGEGTAQGIAESAKDDRLFVAAWGRFDDGARGILYAVSRDRPLKRLAEARVAVQSGEVFLDERHDLLAVFSDEGEVILQFRASTLDRAAPVPAPVLPGDVRYDRERSEGVLCSATGPLKTIDGAAYASVALRPAPLALRPLAPSTSHPSSWLALTWGCDWDPASRKVYVAVANFGLLLTLDYDSGLVLDRTWVGFGARAVELDRARGRLYVANFLGGDVTEWELAGMSRLRTWFVGRFVRGLTLARAGTSLFATSNLGVVRIRL